jgi:hypothetical protein
VQGAITKTGNTHARRLLVEAAWHHRPRYHVGAVMRPAARARGDEGNRRLHRRWVGFLERRKRPTTANVAIARELAGWCWSLAVRRTDRDLICFLFESGGGSAWIDPRHNYEQTFGSTLDPRQADAIQPKQCPAVANPRISV